MKNAAKGQRRSSFLNKYLALAIFLLLSFATKAQIIYTPQTAAGYQFKYLKVDSGFALPVRDTTIGRGVNRPGLMVINPADSLPYYFTGAKWKPVYVDSSGLINLINGKVDSVTLNGNTLFYWIAGIGYGHPLNKLDSLHESNDSVYTCIAGACTFSYLVSAGTGTVTSITGGYGMTGGTITSSGTLAIDTSIIAYKSFVAAHYAAIVHTHDASDIISGTLPIVRGGTGLAGIGSVHQELRVASSGTALEYFTPLSVDSLTTNSDSTQLIYWINGTSHTFYNTTTGLTGGDTTVFQTVVDSTGQPGQRILWSAGNKIKSSKYLLFDSLRNKVVIGNTNISIGGTSTKFYVVGNAIINGNLTATKFIKVGGTSAQYLMADGSVTTSAGGGGSGITKLGSPAYGLTKVNDSTYILDTTIAASQIRLHNDSVTLAAATSANTSSIATKLNISDTTNKWVQTVSLNTGGDSLIVVKNATRTAYKLPSGTGTPDTIHVINQGAGLKLLIPNGTDTLYAPNIQAGANVTLTKNSDSSITISASGGTQVTADTLNIATAGQTVFPFSQTPANKADCFVTVWGVVEDPALYTITAGTGVTFTTGASAGDKVRIHRIK